MDQPQTSTTSVQEKWASSNQALRTLMLDAISYSRSFAKISWSKLPHLVRQNLQNKKWENQSLSS